MSSSRTQSNHINVSGSPSSGEPEYLAVGKLHRPHGVRGEMRMSVWTDFPERLVVGARLYAGTDYHSVHIRSVRGHGSSLLIAFDEYLDREGASALRNQVLSVKTRELPPLAEDELYLHQIIGMQVIQDVDDTPLGNVVEIIETGANDVFIVRADDGADFLLPDIDSVILNIDQEKRTIRVHLLPGLRPE